MLEASAATKAAEEATAVIVAILIVMILHDSLLDIRNDVIFVEEYGSAGMLLEGVI